MSNETLTTAKTSGKCTDCEKEALLFERHWLCSVCAHCLLKNHYLVSCTKCGIKKCKCTVSGPFGTECTDCFIEYITRSRL